MTSVTNESKVEQATKVRGACAANCCGCNAEVAKRIEKGVNGAKAAIYVTLEDGKISAERLLKRARYAVEEGIDESAHQIKRHPVGFLAAAFAAGAALGLLKPRFAKKL